MFKKIKAIFSRAGASPPASAPAQVRMSPEELEADRALFYAAKRDMVRLLWDYGHPRADIIPGVGYYQEGNGRMLADVVAKCMSELPYESFIYYHWARLFPVNACWAFPKKREHDSRHCEFHDQYSKGKATHLMKWGISQSEIAAWEREWKLAEDARLARLFGEAKPPRGH